MYPIHPETVYVLDRVYKNKDAKTRLDAMLASLAPKNTIVLSDSDLQKLVNEKHWTEGYKHRTGFYRRLGPPTLIFNTFRFNQWDLRWHQVRYPKLNHGLLNGNRPFSYRNEVNHLEKNICQAAWEMHSIFGCLHACDYCHVEDFVNIQLNIEELINELKNLIARNPKQQLYKYDNLSDIFSFEPEYNACVPLIEFFATQPNQYLLLYSKSDNIDFLLNAKHNGHTIINWSISPSTQAALIEKGAPSMNKRIEAMVKCQKAGYPVRVRFSPMIPIKNWEEELTLMIQKLLSQVKPDVITLDIIGFMSPKVMKEALDMELFDPQALEVLGEVEKTQHFFGKHTFPHDYRLKIYRHVFNEIRKMDPHVPISICNETKEMWQALDEFLRPMTPKDYVCCCGPTSVPGNPWLK